MTAAKKCNRTKILTSARDKSCQDSTDTDLNFYMGKDITQSKFRMQSPAVTNDNQLIDSIFSNPDQIMECQVEANYNTQIAKHGQKRKLGQYEKKGKELSKFRPNVIEKALQENLSISGMENGDGMRSTVNEDMSQRPSYPHCKSPNVDTGNNVYTFKAILPKKKGSANIPE